MFTNRVSYLLLVAIIVVTGCTPQSAPISVLDKPITLRMAVADEQDTPSTPYVLEFVQQTKILSNGNITIEPVWQAGDDTEAGFEVGVIQLVKKGDMEIGLAASRAFDNENINSFQALQAPFLITNDSLAKAVATSDIATRTLDNLTTAGLAGLTIWPEDLRHPFSLMPDKPLLSPEDFTGLTIRTTPSGVSNRLMEAFGGKPLYTDNDYQGAEAGLRQGAFLIGKPTATGNVTFFSKYQVLFANGAALEKLSDEQRAVLRQAAAATQTKAITEHPGDVEAGTAWCADGGSIVLASEEQLAAFEKAAQPVFDSIKQDPFNAERIAEISELKAKTEASSAASACTPGVAQATEVPLTATSPTISTWTYVAFGDSWPSGDHCNGCRPFPDLYADGLEASTGHHINFINLTTDGGTSQTLLTDIQTSQHIRDAVTSADIIVVSTGANDLEPAFNLYGAGTCGGTDQLDCFRNVAEDWRVNFDGILTEIEALRQGKPTAVRLITNSNEFLADPNLIAGFGRDFALGGGAVITALHHDALCEIAAKHQMLCVDMRPVLNGPNWDKPQDVNTPDAMQAVADALLASGLDELR